MEKIEVYRKIIERVDKEKEKRVELGWKGS